MKFKTAFLLLLVAALCFTACGGEAKRPTDYPNTTWRCDDGNVTFSVSADGKVENASISDAKGNTVKLSVVFSDVAEKTASFYSEDGKELYFSGSCVFEKDSFTLTVKDIYNNSFSHLPPMLIFSSK